MGVVPSDGISGILSGTGTAAVIERARRAQSMMDWIGAIFKVGDVEVTIHVDGKFKRV